MQGLACRKGRPAPSTLLLPSLLLPAFVAGLATLANGSCEFPANWAGEWFQSGKQTVTVNATSFGDRTCVERFEDTYIVYEDSQYVENCYTCLIINDRHENVIQYREVGWCQQEFTSRDKMCDAVTSDDSLYSMFRLNPTPITCPFIDSSSSGPPFTFSYTRGKGYCSEPPSLAASCTDDSKLLLKYQSCPNVDNTESTVEELQCLATWKDGRNKYLVGTLKLFGRSAPGNEETYRCFLYEMYTHHQNRKIEYELAESGDSTCNGLNSVSEGSRTIQLMRNDKKHNRCKYPSWVTKHHDWHSLNSSRKYHFTTGNGTLIVRSEKNPVGTFHEEKIVCHNIEPLFPNDNMQGNRVKLVAHITSGCDIGYVCMIFHKRSSNVIEIQQSSEKAILPDAFSQSDPSQMPYTTLITTTLEERKCPQPGRYTILDIVPTSSLSTTTTTRRQRRAGVKPHRTAEKMTWQEDSEDDECSFTDIQIGCTSPSQSEMIIANTCDREQISYTCHDSWEESGTWYTIVTQKSGQPILDLNPSDTAVKQTLCFSMRWVDTTAKLPGRGSAASRHEQQEQELWLSRPARTCQREAADQWTYKLTSQGVCEDLTRAAASAASSSSLSRVSLVLSAGAAILCKLLSR